MTSLRDRVARRITEIWPSGELASFESLPGGHSGITCLGTVTLPGGDRERLVVKATPPGRRPAGRHDVPRQARILSLVTSAGAGKVSVPEVLVQDDGLRDDGLADDAGEPYFVMRWHPGESVEPVLDPAGHLSPDIIKALCTGGKVNVVIDWEIWSVGDPRVDVGWLVLFCDPGNFPGVGDTTCSMPSARALWDAYEQSAGVSAGHSGWFEALARYKMAAIMGNNLARHRSGRYHDPFQERLTPTIRCLIEGAASQLAGG